MPQAARATIFRFGPFEFDPDSGELRKHGLKLHVVGQPLEVLALLFERPGEVVHREELQKQLWPADTFVEFEHGVNAAVKRLREALGDSADQPRYVETVPRRGYRFIVPVIRVSKDAASAGSPFESTGAPRLLTYAQKTNSLKRLLRRRGLLALCLLALWIPIVFWMIRGRMMSNQYVIAVLPFTNLSVDGNGDYFSDGLTDEIIRNLSLIDGLQVRSRTSAFAFKGKPRNIHEVGALLGANLILEGSVLRDGGRLRINVQLVRVADDVPMWSARFDRDLKDVFAIQDEISRSIVNELRLNLGRGQRRYNTDLETYDLYLKALSAADRPGWYADQVRNSIELFQRVIDKDPSFAPAYAGLAKSYAYLSVYPQSSVPDVVAKMRTASEKALSLDPLLAEAYDTMGLVYSRELAWQDAERSVRRAIQLNPNLSRPHQDLALWVLLPMGRVQEASREAQMALRLDPLSVDVRNVWSHFLIILGRYDDALENCRRTLADSPREPFAEQLYARALVDEGKLTEGIARLEPLGQGSVHYLGYAYARAGRREDAERLAMENSLPNRQAVIYAGLRDKERTFGALERMALLNDPRVDAFPFHPDFAFLRGDPRLNELRRKRHLPPLQ
jgi:TolB-like protein/DNA-binding winged helix-turn-helix (wHTH) protein/tetratricopeptide (TPR) repeat protein